MLAQSRCEKLSASAEPNRYAYSCGLDSWGDVLVDALRNVELLLRQSDAVPRSLLYLTPLYALLNQVEALCAEGRLDDRSPHLALATRSADRLFRPPCGATTFSRICEVAMMEDLAVVRGFLHWCAVRDAVLSIEHRDGRAWRHAIEGERGNERR